MRKQMGVIVAAALLAASGAGAQQYAMLGGAATGRITLSGGSTLRDWSCDVTRFEAAVRSRAMEDGTVATMPSGRERATFAIPVSGIECGNGTMNNHLRNALRGERHPTISVELTGYTITGDSTLRAEGTITVGGRATPVDLHATYTRGNGTLRVQGQKQLRMTELGVEPPRLMLGTLRVDDEITIGFDLVIQQSAVTLAANSAAMGR